MIEKCPKCGKDGQFGYFGEPDQTDVIAMFSHKTGKTYTDVFGRTRPEKKRCFITVKELTSQPWYETWKKKHDEAEEKATKEFQEEMEEDYRRSWYE